MPYNEKFRITLSRTFKLPPELNKMPVVLPVAPTPLSDTPCIATLPLTALMVIAVSVSWRCHIGPALALDGDGLADGERAVGARIERVDFSACRRLRSPRPENAGRVL